MDIPNTNLQVVYQRPDVLTKVVSHYCPGCTHGIAHRLIAEVLNELNIVNNTIGVASVGCSIFSYNYIDIDFTEAPHGRAPAMATGVKRMLPDKIVFTYQGDGDLASIGMGEIIHAAGRGENITVFFINNANYGMTGGQMAPTSVPGQKTTSSPFGRDVKTAGYPIQVSELLSHLEGTSYIVRRSLHDSANIRKAKKAIRTAIEVQMRCLGFSMVELLSTCPTNWGVNPCEAQDWLVENLIPVYPIGDYKVIPEVAEIRVKG
ncbi:MAG: thiamine pyrophosphate-dependent enzyme [Chloroflexota bacterium]|jgi:2-oxoglutarate ferredoxin oxidoreductase subunit beta